MEHLEARRAPTPPKSWPRTARRIARQRSPFSPDVEIVRQCLAKTCPAKIALRAFARACWPRPSVQRGSRTLGAECLLAGACSALRQARRLKLRRVPTDIVVHVAEHASWLQSALPIAATTISALAATASWLSVRTAHRAQIDADLPQLVFHVRADKALWPAHPPSMTIENVGRGVALFPGFVVLSGEGRSTRGYVDRNLVHGDTARFGLEFTTTEKSFGIVFCEDRHNNAHVWSHDRRYRPYKSNQRERLSFRRMMADLYPGREHEIDAATNTPAQPITA